MGVVKGNFFDSAVSLTPLSRLWVWVSLWIRNYLRKHLRVWDSGLGEDVWRKKPEVKNLVRLSLYCCLPFGTGVLCIRQATFIKKSSWVSCDITTMTIFLPFQHKIIPAVMTSPGINVHDCGQFRAVHVDFQSLEYLQRLLCFFLCDVPESWDSKIKEWE